MADVPVKLFRASTVRPNTSPTNPSTPVGEEPIIVNPPGTPSGEYVPYTGATDNVDLGEKGLRSGYYRFDTTPTSTPTDQGTMYWDEDDNTVDIVLNGYIMKVGEDQFYPVKNQTGSNIAKGVAVRFAGTVGSSGRLLIAPFLADGSLPSTRFIGVTAEAIANGEDGKVLWFGRLRGINTSAFAEGDILYASTTVAGGFQTTVPTAPNNIVEIAAVVTDATNGTIFIRPQFISGSSVGAGAGLSIDGSGNIQFGKPTTEFSDVIKLDLKDYTSINRFILSTDYEAWFNGDTVNYTNLDFGQISTDLSRQGADGSTSNISIWNDGSTFNFLKLTVFNSLNNYIGIELSEKDTNKLLVVDQIDSKGLINAGDYESNFTARSLVTKQYVDGAVSGASITIGSPANGLSLAGTVLSLGLASSSTTGALSGTDWSTFNGKLNLISPITGYTVGSNTALAATDTLLGAFGKIQGQVNARVSGTIASGQVAFGTGVNTVGGSNNLFWDNTNSRLGVGTNSPTSYSYLTSAITAAIGNTTANGIITILSSATGAGAIAFADGISGSERFIGEIRYDHNTNEMYFRTNGTNAGLINSLGRWLIGPTATPTNTLDVNGTTRIRTISNLGSTATRFLVASATGVVSERTGAELAADIGATALSGLTTNRIIKATSASTVGNTGITEESDVSYLYGNRTPAGSTSPLKLALGATFGTGAAGANGNIKLSLYEETAGNPQYGFAVRSNALDIIVPSGAVTNFYRGGVLGMQISASSVVLIGRTTSTRDIIITGGLRITSANNYNGLTLGNSAGTGAIGAETNIKLAVYDAGSDSDRIGFGISNQSFEFSSNATTDINFCPNRTLALTILRGGNLRFADARNIEFNTVTGSIIASTNLQRFAFWGKTPIIQPTTAIANATLVGGGGTTITNTDTFGGYTLQQIAQALINVGLLA
jgi:hypothetical protein